MTTTEDILERTIHDLSVQAARDGLITKYERDIIRQVELDAKKYIDLLEQASADGIIDHIEKVALDNLLDDMKTNAEKVALSDNILSRNEIDLLVKLQKIIKRYYY